MKLPLRSTFLFAIGLALALAGTTLAGEITRRGADLASSAGAIVATAAVAPKAAEKSPVEGIWYYSSRTHLSADYLYFEFIKKPDGAFKATLHLPMIPARVPFEFVKVEGRGAKIMTYGIVTYLDMTVSEDGQTAKGTLNNEGKLLLLPFKRVAKVPEFPRPQQPKKPYPYKEEEVVVSNEKAKVRLAGTLTTPAGKGPFPGVMLVSGSGPENRNCSSCGHEIFLVLSDYLTRRGIAVLRVDDRGVGKSTGNFQQVDADVSSQDAECCIEFLKGRPEIDAKKIGLIGHSDGVQAASLLAARSPDVAFVVMLAGQGVTGEKFVIRQTEEGYKALGRKPAFIDFFCDLQREVLQVVRNETDDEKAALQLRKLMKDYESKLTDDLRKAMGVDSTFSLGRDVVGSPALLRRMATIDPAEMIGKVKCPVLALNGDKDLIVSAKDNLPAIEGALRAGGNKDFTVKKIPGLNHLMQTCEVGAPWEYLFIEETFSPTALALVGDWILEHTK